MSLQQFVASGARPFPSHPQVDRYFPAAASEDARKRIVRAIDRGDGPALVIGAAGTGKSLLLQVLATQYHDRFDVVLLGCARLCTRRALLQAILFELGLPYRSRDEGHLRLSLLDQLLSVEQSPAGLLLLIDEAQSLTVPLLDELRVLTNVVRGGLPRVRLVLAGSSALEESFANPELESFSQRLAARTYLAPLNRQETIQFVRAQISASGGAPDEIFAGDALDAVFDATDGVPRLVNQLCDRALVIAEAENRHRVDRDLIQMAWSDLQQLPTPWVGTSPTTPHSPAVVEFAALNEECGLQAPREEIHHAEHDDYTNVCHDQTELELDDKKDQACVTNATPAKRPILKREPRPAGGDPFAEEFDEEEIVLDTFAAWDEVFSSRTPRVENARDLGFSSRVQQAIDAVDAAQSTSRQASEVQRHSNELDIENDYEIDIDEAKNGPDAKSEANWPPIRLAAVEEFCSLKPVPLIAPPGGVLLTGAAAFDPVLPEDAEFGRFEFEPLTDSVLTSGVVKKATPTPSLIDDDPILIIEDDPAEPGRRPSVRRENYRNLFSRLRSG